MKNADTPKGESAGQANALDPTDLSRRMAAIMDKSARALADALTQPQNWDPMGVSNAFAEAWLRLMADPAKLMAAQANFWSDYMTLWGRAATRMLHGEEAEPVAEPERQDRRFRDQAWTEHAVFDFLKQSYLLTSRWTLATLRSVEGMEPKTARKVDFYARQFVDAMSPSNFALTNPEVLRKALETRGESLLKGLDNLIRDLERGEGRLKISMTDHGAFEVGENLALTPGKVIHQNELMQLIQYEPTTEKVHRRPLLIVPPWINKFYILDMRPDNSFIRWAVGEGFTVFVISWVNPDEALARKSFDDYMREGPLDALNAIEKATGEKSVAAVGYCIGGTLLASTLAYMAAKGDKRIASATFLTTLVDFKDAGELTIFIDEEQLQALEARMKERGLLDADAMATTFNLLRANDLIWSFVVSNYLLGNDPFPFDLLHWNSDSTRMPAAMHSFYLRRMYHENMLVEPGGIELLDVPIDLRKIRQPTFFLSTKEDHIAPWNATYAATQLYKGKKTFVLAGSGHIAGVVNPPGKAKYGYWTNTDTPRTPEEWLDGATQHEGSWWPAWAEWQRGRAGALVPARRPGDGALKPIEDAPGSYVKVVARS